MVEADDLLELFARCLGPRARDPVEPFAELLVGEPAEPSAENAVVRRRGAGARE
jgi:hypothetical protein